MDDFTTSDQVQRVYQRLASRYDAAAPIPRGRRGGRRRAPPRLPVRDRRFATADLKLSHGWRLVLLPLLLPVVRPFAVSLRLARRHPWESMQRHLVDFEWTEHLAGYPYVASARVRHLDA